MVENFAWGREWQWGYFKHPPLFAWIAGGWFAVLPRTDAAYYLLAMLNVAVGLGGVSVLARRWLAPQDAALAVIVLATTPFYTWLALKFNANSVLLSVWPWTAVAFLRWIKRGRAREAILAGAMAAVALLGKYFSMLLLVVLVAVALADQKGRRRVFSAQAVLLVAGGDGQDEGDRGPVALSGLDAAGGQHPGRHHLHRRDG